MYTDLYRPKGYEHGLMLTLPDELGAAADRPPGARARADRAAVPVPRARR